MIKKFNSLEIGSVALILMFIAGVVGLASCEVKKAERDPINNSIVRAADGNSYFVKRVGDRYDLILIKTNSVEK